MRLPEPLIEGTLITRYKRFLADVALEDGSRITVHCPNSGSMMGLLKEGNPVLLSKSSNVYRKFPYTWELVKVGKTWAGVNTTIPNRLVYEALLNKQVPELAAYNEIKKETFWGAHSRLDFFLRNSTMECFIEVKNVTLVENGAALFPDARTERGRKHLMALTEIVRQGKRGVMFYLVNREDSHLFRPAEAIDPDYAQALRAAHRQGVEILVYRARIRPPEIVLEKALDFRL